MSSKGRVWNSAPIRATVFTDFDLRYQDGRIAAVEVTAAVDKSANEMETAIKKGGRFVYTSAQVPSGERDQKF